MSRLGERAGRVGARMVVLLFALLSLGQTVTEDFAAIPVRERIAGIVLVICCTAGALVVQNATIRRQVNRGTLVLALVVLALSGLDVMLTGAWAILALAVACIMSMTWSARSQAVALVLLAVATFGALARLYGAVDLGLVLLIAIATVGGFVIHSMTRLVVVVDELRIARERLARLQVDEERERISRDLHDILGRTLVAVALRNETALRLLGRDEDACRAQLTELQTTVMGGQAQLRALTSGPTLVGLDSELTSARDLLGRLEVRLSVDAVEVDDPAVNLAFAAVVRESVTNMLKHSRPTTCHIAIGRETDALVATIVNDRALPMPEDTADGQTGLRELESRLAALGGALTAGPVAGGRFCVTARVPVPESSAPEGGRADAYAVLRPSLSRHQ
ncbi:MAG TPA: histidine kinase [Humibacillus xanthopallidus]|nr:histidine kinase [Humibacillus xanthopallidus]